MHNCSPVNLVKNGPNKVDTYQKKANCENKLIPSRAQCTSIRQGAFINDVTPKRKRKGMKIMFFGGDIQAITGMTRERRGSQKLEI